MTRDLAIATAPRRNSLHWKTGAITWGKVCAWVDSPRTGPKDGPGYVLGTLSKPRRLAENVVSRSVIALDADKLTPARRDALLAALRDLGCAAVVYSTASSTPDAPRLRLLLLPDRDLTPDEYRRAVRYLMALLGPDAFDEGSLQPERFMYMPTTPAEGEFYAEVIDGAPLGVDELLLDAALVPSEAREEPNAPTPADGDAPQPNSPEEAARWLAWGQAGVEAELKRLDECDLLGLSGPYWNNTVYAVACSLLEFANAGWAGIDLDDVPKLLTERAPQDEGFGPTEIAERLKSARTKIGSKPHKPPPPRSTPEEDFDRGAGKPDQAVTDRPSARDRLIAIEVQKLAVRDEAARQYALSRLGDFVPVIRDLVDVARDLASGTVKRPEPSVGGLLYPGRVNAVYGTHTAGKTWVGLYLARENALDGKTLIVDYEDTAEGITTRCLGLDADLVKTVWYVTPEGPLDTEALRRTIEDEGVTLVIIDSVGESLASMGLDSNVERDVTQWFTQVPDALAAMGPAVLLIDHIAKKQDGTPSPVGSFRKSAAITGAQFALENKIGFSRQRAGWSALTCTKDRNGFFATGEIVGRVDFSPHDDGALNVVLKRGAVEVVAVTDRIELNILKVLADRWALNGTLDEDDKEIDGRLTITQIRSSVKGDNTAKREALDKLVERGLVEKHVIVSGPKRTTELYSPSSPFQPVAEEAE